MSESPVNAPSPDFSEDNDPGLTEALLAAANKIASDQNTDLNDPRLRDWLLQSTAAQVSLGMFDDYVALVYLWIAINEPLVRLLEKIGADRQIRINEQLALEEIQDVQFRRFEDEFQDYKVNELFGRLSAFFDQNVGGLHEAVEFELYDEQLRPRAVHEGNVANMVEIMVRHSVGWASRPIEYVRLGDEDEGSNRTSKNPRFKAREGNAYGMGRLLDTVQGFVDDVHGKNSYRESNVTLVALPGNETSGRAFMEMQVLAAEFLTKEHTQWVMPDGGPIVDRTQFKNRVLHLDPQAATALGIIRKIAAEAAGVEGPPDFPVNVRLSPETLRVMRLAEGSIGQSSPEHLVADAGVESDQSSKINLGKMRESFDQVYFEKGAFESGLHSGTPKDILYDPQANTPRFKSHYGLAV